MYQTNNQTDLIEFIKDLFLKPKTFFGKFFDQHNSKPFFGVAFFIFSVGSGVSRADSDLKHTGFTSNWTGYWTMAVFGGAIGGFIAYFIGGWFYNLRMKWSDGTEDLYTARNLFLYSNVVSGAASIASALVGFVLKERPASTVSIYYALITVIFLLFFNLYSVFVSFYGVTSITDVNFNKAKTWFLFIPLAFYSCVYLAAFFVLL